MRRALACLAVAALVTPAVATAQISKLVLARPSLLRDAKARVKTGDAAVMPAYESLLAAAGRALALTPPSVMQKKRLPPSGDKHDYMSMAPYWWPDSTKPNGLPFIRRDGLMYPESRLDHDGIRFQTMTDAVEALALAHYFTGDAKYSRKAGELLRVWFVHTATRMNPNLEFAQAVLGVTKGRGTGIVDTRVIPQLVDALTLLRGAPGWPAADDHVVVRWCRAYLEWLRESRNGADERRADNNHGTWYDAQVIALALFTGDRALARREITLDTKRRIEEQIRPDGSQPRELARTKPIHYTLFNLDPMTQIAEMAPKAGLDLWTYRAPSGGTLLEALRFVAPYADTSVKWIRPEVDGPLVPDDFIRPFTRARARFDDPAIARALASLPARSVDTSRMLLYYPPPRTGRTTATVEHALEIAREKLRRAAATLDPANGYPRSTRADGQWDQRPRNEWTSGFFAATLWQMYAMDRSQGWQTLAERWTSGLEPDKDITTTHDLGFLIFNSFGSGYLLTHNPHYREVVLEASATLARRYDPKVGMIKSWDTFGGPDARSSWAFPVIIDNLMNLEMLFWSARNGGNVKLAEIAKSHALRSARAHLRADGSAAHVALFDPATGALERTTTWQGYSDSSAWARGQAWAIYGFTSAYRNTRDSRFLSAAKKAADFFLAHLPADGVPYWDFRDPAIPNTQRDASAAAIAASALFDLSRMTSGRESARYDAAARRVLHSLAANYLAPAESASILMHSVGSRPQKSEVDVGLVYADYYFVEALARSRGRWLFSVRREAQAADAPGLLSSTQP